MAALAPAAPAGAQATLSALQTDVDAIARRARPSVVAVFAVRAESDADAGTPAATAIPRARTRAGSGVAVEEDLILTSASVVLGAERILIGTANGLQVEAERVGVDPVFNLALLRVSSLRLPPLRMASARPARVGDWVISLGTTYHAQPTQSLGNVAQRHREPGQTLLQLTNTVYPGNSGAAALNIRGELVGVVQGELGSPDLTGTAVGERRPGEVSFAMPVETLRPVLEVLKREGRVRYGYLGVTTEAALLPSDSEGPRTPIGALVEGIVGGSPAERVGLRPGDLIVAYDGERVETPEQLARWVLATPPGREVTLVWVRGETGHTGTAVLREAPERVPEWLAGGGKERAPESPRKTAELERELRRLRQELIRQR